MTDIFRKIALGLMVGAAAITGSCDNIQSSETSDTAASETDHTATMAKLFAIANGYHRSDEHRDRNKYRHPVETLMWFGLEEDMTVVELSPGGLWYSEILGPFLSSRGKLYLADSDPETASERTKIRLERKKQRVEANPTLFGSAEFTVLATKNIAIGPEGSADMVLTFRNVHNWANGGIADDVFAAVYRTLKPGGIFGVVEHRADPEGEADPMAADGYVGQDFLIGLAEGVGFEFVAESEINANPKDPKNHPFGVWTLPPNLDTGGTDDPEFTAKAAAKLLTREEYLSIGESDRMTLKFIKPVAE